ncbi:hypothetical protein L1887_33489 [Cichorium endivia]|nr:hypothetical protein L1887_33489 [Cichorium endivia]
MKALPRNSGKARRKSVVFAQQKENQQQMIQVHMEMRALNSIRNGAFSVLYLFLLFILILCIFRKITFPVEDDEA